MPQRETLLQLKREMPALIERFEKASIGKARPQGPKIV